MINFRLLRNSDTTLWMCVFLLIIIGFLSIYSTTFAMLSRKAAIFASAHIDPWMFMKKHFSAFIIGSMLMAFFSYMDYGNFKGAVKWLYAVMVILLLIVVFAGYESYGAQRWIGIGALSFQPSEISKFILVIVLATYLETKRGLKNISEIIPIALIVLIPFVLVFKQPDLGTSLVFLAIAAGMMIWAQENVMVLFILFTPILSAALSLLPLAWILYLVALCIAVYSFKPKAFDSIMLLSLNVATGLGVPIVWNLLKDYQKTRLMIFLNPSADPYGAGYHTIQSQIAIGAGGLFGRGFLNGTQTQLQFIPQQWTDFIFSMIGEEFGLIGSLIVIGIFFIMIWRAIEIASQARDFYGALLASGIAAMFAFHAAVNIAMTIGVAPVVGIPLPFVSFGGTSLIVNMACIGILQSIHMRRVKLFF